MLLKSIIYNGIHPRLWGETSPFMGSIIPVYGVKPPRLWGGHR